MAETEMPTTTSAAVTQDRQRQIKVCILGAKGAGKTCFLAGLAVLSEPNRKSIITAIHDDPKTAGYLDSLQATLRAGAWPPPTTATVILDMTVMVEGAAVDLRVVDYAGEDFTGALRTLDRESVEELYRFTRDADVFLLLFAPHRDLVDDGSADKAQSLIERQRAHLQAIAQVWREKVGHGQERAFNPLMEVGLVVTQCDRVPGLDSPRMARSYLREHAPHLVERLSDLSSAVECFAVSAIGPPGSTAGEGEANAHGSPPSAIQPFGYEPLFRWIRGHKARKSVWRRPWVWGLAAAIALGAVAVPFIDRGIRSSGVVAVLNDATLSDAEKVERISGWVNGEAHQRRDEFLQQVLRRLDDRLQRATTEEEFQRLRQESETMSASDTQTFRPQFRRFSERVLEQQRKSRFTSLEDGFQAQPPPTAFLDDARRFVETYRSGNDVERVRRMLIDIVDKEIQQRRDTIKGMPLASSGQMAAKAGEVLKFAREFERQLPEEEVKGMRTAAEIARLASQRGQWEVALKRSGGLTTAYWQTVIVSNRQNGQPIHEFNGAGDTPIPDKTWSASPATFGWQAGEPLRVALKIEGRLFDVPIGYLDDQSQMAIRIFVGRKSLNVEPGAESYVADPYVEFRLKKPGGEELTRDDWQAVEDFILPGSRW
jgi:hypothetical protein